MDVMDMIAAQVAPHLGKIGTYLEDVDVASKDQGITNTAMLITKRRDPKTGEVFVFLAHVEKPESLKYVKDENGKPKIEGIENLFSVFK